MSKVSSWLANATEDPGGQLVSWLPKVEAR